MKVSALNGRNSRTVKHVGIAGRIDYHLRSVGLTAGFILNRKSAADIAVHYRLGYNCVKKQVNPFVFDKLRHCKRKNRSRKTRKIPHVGFSKPRLAVLPLLRDGVIAVLNRKPKQLLRHSLNYLNSSAVAHRHKQIYKSGCRKSAKTYRFLNKKNAFPHSPHRNRGCNTRDAAAGNDYVIVFNVFGFSFNNILHVLPPSFVF